MTGPGKIRHIKTIVRARVRLIASLSGLALIGALACSGAQVLGAAPALAAPGSASPHSVQPMAVYGNILNVASDKCLGTYSGHNQTYTVIWTCNGTRNQSWTVGAASPYNGVYHQIKNKNGDCLGLSGGRVGQGTPVVAWTCQSTAKNQYWFHFYDTAVSQYVLCNLLQPCTPETKTGRVAGVAGGAVSNGARVVLWDNNGDQNQDWYCASACTP